ncbi:Uma2 family endonuclease [uncultured Thiocystis sp.]|jgi:Uma2 family endonuclease|uniref:Uma2 family endonuclease n=1 Tax=uncultured Thiocystis sp. TaxID=1202134 RepID=UPI0025DA28C8|nr:Uma2 family endonuclease [uncultured Thiocystis sp.]
MNTSLNQDDLPHYREEDYRQWEGDWELIHGIPYAMAPSPVKLHQKLTLAIGNALLTTLDDCPDCEVLLETDWVVKPDTIFRPDVALVCHDDNPRHIARAPEIVFEVISPSTAKRDEGLKRREYEEAGVKYYVLIYPDTLLAKLYRQDGSVFRKVAECETERFEFEGLPCRVAVDFATVFRRFR